MRAFWTGDCRFWIENGVKGARLVGIEQNGASQKRLYTGGTPVQLEGGRSRAGASFAGTLWRPGCPCHYQREHKSHNMCFSETNPPFFRDFSDASGYEYIGCNGNLREKSVGSFSKTNPPEKVFGVVSGGKWGRFREIKPVAVDDSGVLQTRLQPVPGCGRFPIATRACFPDDDFCQREVGTDQSRLVRLTVC